MQPNGISIFNNLKIIHTALLIGMVLFGIFVYTQNGQFIAEIEDGDIFVYIVPIVAFSAYFLGMLFFKKMILRIKREDSLKQKLEVYQKASLVNYAFLEAAAMLALVAYFLKGTALYLVIALCIMVFYISKRPTINKLLNDLPLSIEETNQLTK
ncbi:MAG: hypothetical protein CML05_13935 [Pseudozobellia sp.]|nr:hypothetical protein [Pseudozobellia sp.]|tara:strand:- start:711 stop:1172 length:462 start_codon:yes stop_codon:yes gene_type:complete